MCGISGVWSFDSREAPTDIVTRMADQMVHRGPDDFGTWSDVEQGVALGHRRLSILDLSPQGHQPMVSTSGRYVIVFNGEIYNFAQLREELSSVRGDMVWRGHSDTEVLLAAIEAWGIEGALRRATGMFAVALWDRSEKKLILVRDRIGEKPLYYGIVGERLLFASELKSIRAGVDENLQVDREVLSEYLRFGYTPAPFSIYQGIFKLRPGHMVEISGPADLGAPRRFWSLHTAGQDELRARLANYQDDELIEYVHARLREAIALQTVTDVPLGAFLSGGIDSSTVVALMQAQSMQQVRTYTIGFREELFNEAPYARAIARHLGTEHTEMYVSARDAAELIPQLPHIYDEPFADSSQIPTALVSRLTRRHVTVSLSGDGGDELFAGYPRYQITAALWKRINQFPMSVRRAASLLLTSLSAQNWDAVFAALPAKQREWINGRRVHRFGQLMLARSIGEMYVRLMSQWQPEEMLVLGERGRSFELSFWPGAEDAMDAMRKWDLNQYLPDDLLVKVDRASMFASLETRAPLLDHRVVEAAFALPQRVLVRDGVGKWVLRRILDQYVPRELVERPKAGFSIPLGEWLKGSLREWAEDLLSKVRVQGFLDPGKVERMWSQHLAGSFDRSLHLWNVLMFQAWLDANGACVNKR